MGKVLRIDQFKRRKAFRVLADYDLPTLAGRMNLAFRLAASVPPSPERQRGVELCHMIYGAGMYLWGEQAWKEALAQLQWPGEGTLERLHRAAAR